MKAQKRSNYQKNYSLINPDMYAFSGRRKKALKIMMIIREFLAAQTSKQAKDLNCLEVGASVGGMTKIFSQHFKKVTGTDIDRLALKKARQKNNAKNIKYQYADVLSLPFGSGFFDVVICNNIYEHVPDPFKMVKEIYRVLKKGGFCYFCGPYKYTLMERHYGLPFLSWLPKRWASSYLQITGRGDQYYETFLSVKELDRLVADFAVFDYTFKVLKNPQEFQSDHQWQSLLSHLPTSFLSIFRPFLPNFFWILQKNKPPRPIGTLE